MKIREHFTFDPAGVKDYHEKLTLNVIRENAVISSSELIRNTRLNKSTVFSILKELSYKSLIVSTGKGEATDKGGVRPKLWKLNSGAFYAIGIDVEIGEMTAVILDLTGEAVKRNIYKVKVSNNLDELVESIIYVIDSIILDAGISKTKILGCCIAFTGIVDYLSGIVVMSGILFNLNLQLLDKLKHRFPFPLLVENNANAAAIGEKWTGQGKNKNNFLVLLVELDINVAGLGIGIILEGNIYRGASFSAGELYPHMPNLKQLIDIVRPKFPEGKLLKDYVSVPEELDINSMIEMARSGDEIAILIFSIFGRRVGEIIAPSIALLNPDTLIITGTIAELGEIIISPIENAIQMNVLAVTSNALKIVAGKNQQFSVAVGAASLVLSNFFKLPMSGY